MCAVLVNSFDIAVLNVNGIQTGHKRACKKRVAELHDELEKSPEGGK